MTCLVIDGSYGEGGGQLSRYAVALAAISGRPLQLENIRAKRAKPGLMAQHLTALRAVAEVAGGSLEGAEIGATEIYYRPDRIRGGDYRFDVGTAGSIVLVLQALLPVALHADKLVELTVTGGTDVKMAPPVDYLLMVFLPWLARMGVKVRVESVRHGYYPKGGGAVSLQLEPCGALRPLLAEQPGALRQINGVAHVAHLPRHIPERMAAAARDALADLGAMQIGVKVLGAADAFGTGGAIVLAAETEHAVLGAASVAERGVPAERLGADAGYALRAELETGAAVDIHACDQLLIYAAQARDTSRFLVRKVSQHARTVMWLIEQFLPVEFRVEPWRGLYRVEVRRG
ncbi:RNA 3'-terminal phosphate cyclase (ATP) [Microbulbifer donghaiensis]|uniref:RNA 3'-terminal phosphate cyclase n=1 Tax=Microbulbifer donghaiensis TaxID=494016 RepID=A0A1M5D5Z4_9GAMM|nr:RNA 3'-terminal phosphate cyclase [Microbulbifer donghaiensis]SHF62493.1 RNA 3'-terminal phosphate cyclase (ATP) [Microbulbifer donghaiensis]